MKQKVNPNPQETSTQEAELLAEYIQENPKAAPSVDFDEDYALAKEMAENPDNSEEETQNASSD